MAGIGAIREALDDNGFGDVQIMSYAAKYASGLLRPVPRRDRLGEDADRRQAHLSDGQRQYR